MAHLGQLVWYDLMTADPAAAAAFYGEVLGWKTNRDDPNYEMWSAGGEAFGGLMALPEDAKAAGAPPQWVGYTKVADVEATVAQCTALGGTVIVPPTPIAEDTHFAMMLDPEGATFAVYASTRAEDADWTPPTSFEWAELNTNDWTAARSFYTQLFGWAESGSMSMDGSGSEQSTYWMFGRTAEKSMGGMSNTAPMMGGHPFWLYYATTNDLDGAVERVKAHGGRIMNGPMDVPGGDRIAQCVDPQGGWFALYEAGSASKG